MVRDERNDATAPPENQSSAKRTVEPRAAGKVLIRHRLPVLRRLPPLRREGEHRLRPGGEAEPLHEALALPERVLPLRGRRLHRDHRQGVGRRVVGGGVVRGGVIRLHRRWGACGVSWW